MVQGLFVGRRDGGVRRSRQVAYVNTIETIILSQATFQDKRGTKLVRPVRSAGSGRGQQLAPPVILGPMGSIPSFSIVRPTKGHSTVRKPELGTKRRCNSCEAKFFFPL